MCTALDECVFTLHDKNIQKTYVSDPAEISQIHGNIDKFWFPNFNYMYISFHWEILEKYNNKGFQI